MNWALISGKTYYVIDLDLDLEAIFLTTYDILGQNYWFPAAILLPASEPKNVFINKVLEEDQRIADFQKRLRDKMMRDCFCE